MNLNKQKDDLQIYSFDMLSDQVYETQATNIFPC